MTQYEKLVELLCVAPLGTKTFEEQYYRSTIAKIADFLLKEGIIVQPCKIGDVLYCDGKHFAPHCEGEIHSFVVDEIVTEIRSTFRGDIDYCFDFKSFGKTVFHSKEDMQNKGGDKNE